MISRGKDVAQPLPRRPLRDWTIEGERSLEHFN
jgi:hypothetical protein